MSVAAQTGLFLTWLVTLMTGFLPTRFLLFYIVVGISDPVHDMETIFHIVYRNDPMFLDIWVWAISADPDQTAPRGAV